LSTRPFLGYLPVLILALYISCRCLGGICLIPLIFDSKLLIIPSFVACPRCEIYAVASSQRVAAEDIGRDDEVQESRNLGFECV
jgi:hypothetical protein